MFEFTIEMRHINSHLHHAFFSLMAVASSEHHNRPDINDNTCTGGTYGDYHRNFPTCRNKSTPRRW